MARPPRSGSSSRTLATEQSVNGAVKFICDIMRRSNCAGAGVKTNLLFSTKGKPTEHIWYYDLSDVKVGKKAPLTLHKFEEFFRLLPERADSHRLRGGKRMIEEMDTVVLTHDIPEHGLKRGDVGAVVYCYADGAAWEVEFVAAEGTTLAVLTLSATDVRPMGSREILHVRELASA